jgi:hypothetical protein
MWPASNINMQKYVGSQSLDHGICTIAIYKILSYQLMQDDLCSLGICTMACMVAL